MARFEALAGDKRLLPTGDPRPSYTYVFGRGRQQKRVHFLADGWTINHNGSLHGSPIASVQLELAIVFENLARAASQRSHRAGGIGQLSAEAQNVYVKALGDLQ
jgi:hypothetical protein